MLGGNNSSEFASTCRDGSPPAIPGWAAWSAAQPQGGNPSRRKYGQKLDLVGRRNLAVLNTHVNAAETKDKYRRRSARTSAGAADAVRQTIRRLQRRRQPGFLAARITATGAKTGRDGRELGPREAKPDGHGHTVQWYSERPASPPLPETPWAIQFTDRGYQRATHGSGTGETNCLDQIEQAEPVATTAAGGVRQLGLPEEPRPDKDKHANRETDWVAYIGGSRA